MISPIWFPFYRACIYFRNVFCRPHRWCEWPTAGAAPGGAMLVTPLCPQSRRAFEVVEALFPLARGSRGRSRRVELVVPTRPPTTNAWVRSSVKKALAFSRSVGTTALWSREFQYGCMRPESGIALPFAL